MGHSLRNPIFITIATSNRFPVRSFQNRDVLREWVFLQAGVPFQPRKKGAKVVKVP